MGVDSKLVRRRLTLTCAYVVLLVVACRPGGSAELGTEEGSSSGSGDTGGMIDAPAELCESSGLCWAVTRVAELEGEVDAAAVGDVDGDGRMDLVFASGTQLRHVDEAGSEHPGLEISGVLPGGLRVVDGAGVLLNTVDGLFHALPNAEGEFELSSLEQVEAAVLGVGTPQAPAPRPDGVDAAWVLETPEPALVLAAFAEGTGEPWQELGRVALPPGSGAGIPVGIDFADFDANGSPDLFVSNYGGQAESLFVLDVDTAALSDAVVVPSLFVGGGDWAWCAGLQPEFAASTNEELLGLKLGAGGEVELEARATFVHAPGPDYAPGWGSVASTQTRAWALGTHLQLEGPQREQLWAHPLSADAAPSGDVPLGVSMACDPGEGPAPQLFAAGALGQQLDERVMVFASACGGRGLWVVERVE